MIKRGEVYGVSLDPTVGAEIKKTRPAMVVSNNLNNQHAKTVTVAPVTGSVDRIYPFEVRLDRGTCGNPEPCKVKADQVRTVDKRRLGKLMGTASDPILRKVADALRLHLGL